MKQNVKDYEGNGNTDIAVIEEFGYVTVLPDGRVVSRGGWADKEQMKAQVERLNAVAFGDERYVLISRMETKTVTYKTV